MLKKTCILLSAGRSERTGFPKGMIEVDGEPWIERQCRVIEANAGTEIVIVLGYHFDTYVKHLGGRFRVVKNPEPELGQFSSLQVGLKAVGVGQDTFLLPIDVPCPSREVWAKLSDSLPDKLAAIPTFNGRGGHPALLSTSLFQTILETPSGEGRLDQILHQLPPEKIARIPVSDPAICENWNRPENYSRSAN